MVSFAAVVGVAFLAAPFFIHRTAYFYSDGAGYREEVTEAAPPLRRTLWQPALSLSDRINQPETDEYEPRLSPGGRFLVFTRGQPGTADLWLCERGIEGWGKPAPLVEINSPFDDMGACFGLVADQRQDSADTVGSRKLLVLFYSNRPGGEGGYDLWASLRHEDGVWSSPWNLGPQVNSPFNEYSPSITADAQLLLFASNRARGKDPEPPRWTATVRETYAVPDYDIYHASRSDVRAIDFGEALRLEGLSLPDFSEGTIAIAPDADYIYFASNRPEGKGGFDLYRARFSGHLLGKPENLGPQVNTRGQELDPALSENGSELYFARQPESGRTNDIFVAVSREVHLETAPGEAYWTVAAVRHFLIRILAAVDPTILALLLSFLLCLSFALLLSSRRLTRPAVLARCMAIALLVHLVGALWMDTRKVHRVLLGTLGDKEVLGSFEVDLAGEAEDEIAFLIRSKVAVTGRDSSPSLETGLPRVFAMAAEYDSTPRVLELDAARFTASAPTAPVVPLPEEDVSRREPVPAEPLSEEAIQPLVVEESTPLDPALPLAHRGPTAGETPEREVRAVEFTSRVNGAVATYEELGPLSVDLVGDVEPEPGSFEPRAVDSPQPVVEVVLDPLEREAIGLEAPSGPTVDVAAPRRLQGAEPTAPVRASRLQPRIAQRPSRPWIQRKRVLVGPMTTDAEPARTPGRVDVASPPMAPPQELASRAGDPSGRAVESILGGGLPPGDRGDDPEGRLERRGTTAPEIPARARPSIELVARVEGPSAIEEGVGPMPVDLVRPISAETSAVDARFRLAPAQVFPVAAERDRGDPLGAATLALDSAPDAGPAVHVASRRRIEPARPPAPPKSLALARQRERPQSSVLVDTAHGVSPLVSTRFSSSSVHALPEAPAEPIAVPSARDEVGPAGVIEIVAVSPAAESVAAPALGRAREPRHGTTPHAAQVSRRAIILSVAVSRNEKTTSEEAPSLTAMAHLEPARALAKDVEPWQLLRSPVETVSRPAPLRASEGTLRLEPSPVRVTQPPRVATERPVKSRGFGGTLAPPNPELLLERRLAVVRHEAMPGTIQQRGVGNTRLPAAGLKKRPVPHTPSAVERSAVRVETRREVVAPARAALLRPLDAERASPPSPPRLARRAAPALRVARAVPGPRSSAKRPRPLLIPRVPSSSALVPAVSTQLPRKIRPAQSGPTQDAGLNMRVVPAVARRATPGLEPASRDRDVAGTLGPVRRPRDERPSLVARAREVPSLRTRPGRAKERTTLGIEARRFPSPLLSRQRASWNIKHVPKPVSMKIAASSKSPRGARIAAEPKPVSAPSISSSTISREKLEPSLPPPAPRVTLTARAMRERLVSSARRGGPPRPRPPRVTDVGMSPEMRPWVYPLAPLHPYLVKSRSGTTDFEQGEHAGALPLRPADPALRAHVARIEPQVSAGIEEPSSLEPVAATSAFVPRIYELRSKARRKEAVKLGGGSDATERAVDLGLAWLALHQSPDGRWSLSDYTAHLPESSVRDRWHPDWRGRGRYDSRGGSSRASNGDTAATSLALLAFLGHGDTHVEPGAYRSNVSEGLRFLVRQQRPDGDLRGGGNLYMHAIATFAICEAYALTRSPELQEPARLAIDFTVRTQNPTRGGWRYVPYPRGKDVDTSVFGWMIMGIKSAHLAGIKVDERCMSLLGKYLDSVRMSADGGRYAYQPGLPRSSLAMVAQGLFCQQVLSELRPQRTARQNLLLRRATNESVSILLSNRPEPRDQDGTNFYYWYYAALALFQEEGVAWSTWNARMKPVLLDLQVGESGGTAAGSWDPLSRRARLGGRVYSTAISILSLEVYYRYAPKER